MKTKFFLIAGIGLFVSSFLSAQTFKGIVRNSNDSSAVTFAIVRCKDKACQSGLNGKFELSLAPSSYNPADSIMINCLGYADKVILVNKVQAKELTVYLIPQDILLGEAPANGYTIKTILKKAQENIPKNYPSGTFIMNAFYRQYHKENDKYVRLIESDISIYHKSIDSVGTYAQKELVKLNQMRRSASYEENKEQHGDHLIDLLSENPVRYTEGTVLNSKAFDWYTFHMEPEESTGGEKFYHISFLSKPGSMQKTERGEVTIDEKTFAVTHIKIIQGKNEFAKADAHPNPGKYTWKFINGVYEASFEKAGNKYYPTELTKSYLHELVNNRFHSVDYNVEETFSLFYNASSYRDVNASEKSGYYASSDLYGRKYVYIKNFWDTYDNHKEHFPFKKVIGDLSLQKPLEAQYREGK